MRKPLDSFTSKALTTSQKSSVLGGDTEIRTFVGTREGKCVFHIEVFGENDEYNFYVVIEPAAACMQ